MDEINKEAFQSLPSDGLAARIDAFFEEEHRSRYKGIVPALLVVGASDILHSVTVWSKSPEDKRNILLLFYRTQFQIKICTQHAAFANHAIDEAIRNHAGWRDPATQVRHAAARQSMIVSARVAFDCLMEFVSFAERGSLLRGKAKFRRFREWIARPGNRFGWLIFYMLVIRRYDVIHREREVHGTSRVADEALLCTEWPRNDGEGDAINVMLNVWRPILETLNGTKPTSYFSGARDFGLSEHFFKWAELDLSKFWEDQTTRATETAALDEDGN
jgi:hypothetical protein